ncbi:ABC transporter substrate-binding protein [candidate division WOR-3 bacterium]|nr:ABC transporter substrate-binding protein [candidate division WOR-3 bacterium]
MNKRFFALFSLAVLSCSNGQRGKVTVTFWHAMGGRLGTVLDSLVEDFNGKHTEIRIISSSVGNYGALAQKLMASVMAGKPPVMAQSYESWTDQFRRAGAIVPLNAFVESDAGYSKDEIEDFFRPVWENNYWGDTIWSMPFNKSLGVLFYNADFFDSAGISFPSTWEEMVRLCSLFPPEKNDYYAFALPSNTWFFETALFQRKGRLLDDATGEVYFDDSISAQLLTELVFLLKSGNCRLGTGYDGQDEFVSGNILISWGSVVSYSFMAKKNPSFRIGIATLPAPLWGEDVSVISGTNIVIFSKSSPEQQVAAWEFIKWFNSPEVQAAWSASTGYVPTRKSSLDARIMKSYMSGIRGLEEVYLKMSDALTEPKTGAWFAGRIYLSRSIEYALREVVSPEKSLRIGADKLRRDLREDF